MRHIQCDSSYFSLYYKLFHKSSTSCCSSCSLNHFYLFLQWNNSLFHIFFYSKFVFIKRLIFSSAIFVFKVIICHFYRSVQINKDDNNIKSEIYLTSVKSFWIFELINLLSIFVHHYRVIEKIILYWKWMISNGFWIIYTYYT